MKNSSLYELYRRLFYFQNGDVDTHLLLLANPNTVKDLIKYDVVTASNGKEQKGVANWYKLTENGKTLFNDLPKDKLSEEVNHALFIEENIPFEIHSIIDNIAKQMKKKVI